MNRYLSIEHYSGELIILTESDDYANAINSDNVADWVWQYAENPTIAALQHSRKVDEWEADPTKRTY